MSLNGAQDRALMAHLTLGVGLASVLLAVTIRRLRAKHRDKHAVSYRAKAMAPNLDLPFIIEHFARLNDPDYVCVSIAENKLTVCLFWQITWTICVCISVLYFMCSIPRSKGIEQRNPWPNSRIAQSI